MGFEVFLILFIFLIVFSVPGVAILIQTQPGNLFPTRIYGYGLVAIALVFFVGMIQLYRERKRIGDDFEEVIEGKSASSHPVINEICQYLVQHINLQQYQLECNDHSFQVRTHPDLRQEFSESMIFLSTRNPRVFVELQATIRNDGKIVSYSTGRSISFHKSVTISKDNKGYVVETQSSKDSVTLGDIIKDSQRQCGWKTKFDVASNIGLIMGIIGFVGALITIILLLFFRD